MIPSKKISDRFANWPQWLAAGEVFLISATFGLMAGWVSPYLAKLSNADSQLHISKEDASWIASLVCITKPVGAVLEILFVKRFGSKSTTLISGLFLALGWMCFFIKNSVALIYAYRIFCGIGAGIMYSVYPLYIGEISEPAIRGALVSFVMQGLMIGNLIGAIMGAYLDTWVFAAISLVPTLLSIILLIFLPHSPHHLVSHNEIKEAAKSIQWYKRDADVESDLLALEKFINNNSHSNKFAKTFRNVMTPINLKTLRMLIFVYGFFHLSGLFTISAYMEIMLIKSRVTVLAPATVVMIVSGLSVVSTWLAIYTNDKYGRTIMFTISSIGIATGLFIWGLNYHLLDLGFENPHLQWMSIIAAVIYKIALGAGLMTIPATLMSEMFAPDVKALSACITTIFASIFSFIGSKTYQPMVDALSEKYVFWIYAAIMVLSGIYTMFFVPETKGKTLKEIQELLVGKKIEKSSTKYEYRLVSGKLLKNNKLPVV